MTEINRAGFRWGMVAFTATVGFFVVQLLQLLKLLSYPWDEILIYGFSTCIPIPFLLEILALHYRVAPKKRYWTQLQFYSPHAMLFL